MIISISGRKNSGKTTCANILIEKGFKKISFADGLKEYVSKIYDWDIQSLYNQTEKEKILDIPAIWDKTSTDKLSQLINAKVPFDSNKILVSRREALQYIGTNILRDLVDPNFHLNEFTRRYNNENSVCDDVRFYNELDLIKKLGGIPYFVFRPFYWNYDNHESEISLNWTHFENVIVNSGSYKKLYNHFNKIVNYITSVRKHTCNIPTKDELNRLLEDNSYSCKEVALKLKCSTDKVLWWVNKYCIHIDKNYYTVNHRSFLDINEESAYWAGFFSADGCIKANNKHYVVELPSCDKEIIIGFKKFVGSSKTYYKCKNNIGKQSYQFYFNSPFVVENLKLWCVEPLKSRVNKIPDIIKNNDGLLCYWISGLIDGDGSIFYYNCQKSCCISILASEQIIDFIQNWTNINCHKYSEKGIDNLFNLRFNGLDAIDFYNKIYKGIGLNRKWDKVADVIKKYPRVRKQAITKDYLIDVYTVKKLLVNKIAEDCKLHICTIYRLLKKYNITPNRYITK